MWLLDRWFRSLDDSPYLTIVMGVVGAFFLVIAWRMLRRRSRKGELLRSRVSVMLIALFFGVFLLGSACFVLVRWPARFQTKWLELVKGDFADAGMLAQLRRDELEVPAADRGELVDWPQWRGPRRDAANRESKLRTDWQANPPKVLWRQSVGKGYSSVAVRSGRLYLQDALEGSERVLCLNAEDGQPVWSYQYPSDAEHGGYHGPRATPTVHEGRVYTVGSRGKFLCLDASAASGKAKVLWEHELIEEFTAHVPMWGVACSPLIEGNLVVVQPGGTKGSVVAFDRLDGKLVWKALEDPSGYSSPVAAACAGVRQVICFTADGLAGLRATDGNVLWEYPWKTSFSANIATPVVAGDYVFISSGYNTGCALLKLSREGEGVRCDPVYVKRNKLMRNHQSTCVFLGGFLYGFDSRGSGEQDVRLRCVDLRTGEERWSTADVGKGVPLAADGHLVLLYSDGTLRLVEATPEAYREKGSFAVFAAQEVWALPALAGSRLYVRSHKEVVCLDVGR